MEVVFALLVGLLFAAASYLLLSRHLVRLLLGVAVLGNAVNLLLFTVGRVTREQVPIIAPTAETLPATSANPLPQALILTAIVISFSFFAFLLVLAARSHHRFATSDINAMQAAEPPVAPLPPLGY